MIDIIYERYSDGLQKVLETVNHSEATEWLDERGRLARAIGFDIKRSGRLLYVLDKEEVLALYYYR